LAWKVFSDGHRLEVERTPISDSGVLLDINHDKFKVNPFMHASLPDVHKGIVGSIVQVDSDCTDLVDSFGWPKSILKSTSNVVHCCIWDIEEIDGRIDNEAGIAQSWNLVIVISGGEGDLSSEVSKFLAHKVVGGMVHELKAIATYSRKKF
jgi:hypothetical protein